jgi:hypothetical protein
MTTYYYNGFYANNGNASTNLLTNGKDLSTFFPSFYTGTFTPTYTNTAVDVSFSCLKPPSSMILSTYVTQYTSSPSTYKYNVSVAMYTIIWKPDSSGNYTYNAVMNNNNQSNNTNSQNAPFCYTPSYYYGNITSATNCSYNTTNKYVQFQFINTDTNTSNIIDAIGYSVLVLS